MERGMKFVIVMACIVGLLLIISILYLCIYYKKVKPQRKSRPRKCRNATPPSENSNTQQIQTHSFVVINHWASNSDTVWCHNDLHYTPLTRIMFPLLFNCRNEVLTHATSFFSTVILPRKPLDSCNFRRRRRLHMVPLFWDHTWQSAQWRALCTEITEVNLSATVYRLFSEDVSLLVETDEWSNKWGHNEWREIFMKQSLDKCRGVMIWLLCRLFLSVCVCVCVCVWKGGGRGEGGGSMRCAHSKLDLTLRYIYLCACRGRCKEDVRQRQ